MDDFSGFKNEITVEWPVNNMPSPSSVVQCCLKLGSRTVKSIFLDLAFRLDVNWRSNSGDWLMYIFWNAPLWSILSLESL